jgi:class 3 adenylate cyclase
MSISGRQIKGDSFMAFCGAPSSHQGDAANAIAEVLAMQSGMSALNDVNPAQGMRAMDARIGVTTGLVVAGDLVSQYRLRCILRESVLATG